MAFLPRIHRNERERMLLAFDVLSVFNEHATSEAAPADLDRRLAPLLGLEPEKLQLHGVPDELWPLSLGPLHVGCLLAYQIASGEGRTPERAIARARRVVEGAALIE